MGNEIILLLGSKTFWGGFAAVLSFAASVPYIVSIIKGTTVPHVISWLIWAITTLTVFAAQWLEKGGPGSWSTLVGGLIPLVVIMLSLKYPSDVMIRRSDWAVLIVSLLTLPLWWMLDDPLLSVIILVTIDIVAYWPTLHKSWKNPYQEQTLMYNLLTMRNIISIFALQHYSWTTVLFPALTSLANIVLVSMIYLRRRVIKPLELSAV